VRYAYKPTWHYFTVVRGEKFPLKISSTNVEELQSVYEGIVTVLDKEARNGQSRMEQRRDYNMETYY
jgi:flagellar biosynthesis/type III secretory pathway chaperone